MTSEHGGPIPDSYWVRAPLVLAGPLPIGADRAALRASMRALLDAGVRTVIDLRTPMESPGIRVPLSKQARDDEHVVCVNIPVLNGAAPTEAELSTILDVIDSEVRRERAVYVHCQGGLGRTGTVVAAYWIRHGMFDPEGALEALSQRRVGQPHGEKSSPESGAQFRLVRSWRQGK